MPSLIWSPPALRDVQRIFLAEKDLDSAKRAVKAIRSAVKVIGLHPEIGRPAEEMEPEYRQWPIDFGASGYSARYRYDEQTAVIVAVRPPEGS